jgi:hypothetical protein
MLDATPTPDRIWKQLRVLTVFFALLGALGLAGTQASFPQSTTVAVSDLRRDWDGLLVGDFERPWPFKINKSALDQITVALPDGTELGRSPTRQALAVADSGSGFAVNRPEIVFRLDDATRASPEALLSVTLPVKTRDILYQLPLGIAAILFLMTWGGLRPTLRALWWRPAAAAGALLGIALAGFLGLRVASGAFVWLALLALLTGPLIAAAVALQARARAMETRSRARDALVSVALVVSTVLGTCVLFEAWLGLQSADLDRAAQASMAQEDWFQLPAEVVQVANSREEVLTLPDAWRRKEQTIEDASAAYTWHGALHVYDQWGFRRLNGPFPPKDPATLRTMVVGDSLTYGEGLAEEWTYSRILERSLQRSHRVEVINLGRNGFQSQDILWVLQNFLPRLHPDLVVYVVCLNDFLPSGEKQDPGYAFPLPIDWKTYLFERTSLAWLANDAYQGLLLALDVQRDFYDQILAGGEAYQRRFARDVAAMNQFVREAGLPPMIGIVFHQWPGGDPRGWDLVEVAEQALADAGFDLISVMSWRERFEDRILRVSRWEAHPNELAHSLIAKHLHERLLGHEKLGGYRIDDLVRDSGKP